MTTPSTHARAAKAIRAEIKAAFPSVTFTCKSESYANGSSVNVTITDQPAHIAKAIEKIVNKYQYGHFDGMNDIYEYSNVTDQPQVKYAFVKNEASEAMRQAIYDTIRTGYAGGETLPASYDAGCNVRFHGDWVSSLVWRLFNGSTEGFWSKAA